MFNPFYPFTTALLDAFIKHDKKYFVRQTFNRAREPFDEGIKGCYLITHYETLHEAKVHFDALKQDPNRFLYVWTNPEHQQRLQVAASSPEGYKIYSSTFQKDWEKLITKPIQGKIRSYVKGLGWNPSREEGLRTDFYQTFGELYITLKYRTQEVRVKFEEIEKSF